MIQVIDISNLGGFKESTIPVPGGFANELLKHLGMMRWSPTDRR